MQYDYSFFSKGSLVPYTHQVFIFSQNIPAFLYLVDVNLYYLLFRVRREASTDISENRKD